MREIVRLRLLASLSKKMVASKIFDELVDPEEDEAAAAEAQEETSEELTSSDFQQDAE